MTLRKNTKKPLKKKTTPFKKASTAGKSQALAKKGKGPAKKKGALKSKTRPPKKAKAPKAVKAAVATRENPAAQALARRIAQLLVEKKSSDVVILNVMGKSSYTDYVVVASGDSDRQVSAMAENVETSLKQEAGHRTLGSEGQQGGNWVLLDYGDVVAHLFLADTRAFYDLEGMWTDAPKERVA